MSATEISRGVQQFIADHLSSVAELELLLLLRGRSPLALSAADAAHDLRVEREWTARQLESLAARGFATAEGGTPRYSYAPRTPELDRAVAELAALYADRRVSVITLIYSKPADPIRSFARAFKIREDK